ncbi:hypothetical protein MUK42_36825 [Musa troglodytarum]|uniref:Uncharacterized protein n=1 Tax=Musa troglodytarum TaxID=320322 RepID=A0A9E7EAD0_9LILI|nr:hypothetical protein MUK42_36825 [Musa troglodytarum]
MPSSAIHQTLAFVRSRLFSLDGGRRGHHRIPLNMVVGIRRRVVDLYLVVEPGEDFGHRTDPWMITRA